MGFLRKLRRTTLGRWLNRIFGKGHARIGIYGPPNSGKTTLANRIINDWSSDLNKEDMGTVTEVPHETRMAKEVKNVVLQSTSGTVKFDIIDTPGITTKVDFHEFVEDFGIGETDSRKRAREATQGVIDAIKWLDEVDGILLIIDSAQDPYTQVNITILGNLEARKLPVILIANKIDLTDSSPAAVRDAFPQHPVIPISALTGYNMEKLYRSMVKYFR